MATSSLRISRHAAQRFVERAAPGLSTEEALELLARLAGTARSRSTPRWWMRDAVAASPGLRFLYPSADPRICLLVRQRTVVTVVTRNLLRSSRVFRSERRPAPPRPERRSERRGRRARCWNTRVFDADVRLDSPDQTDMKWPRQRLYGMAENATEFRSRG